MYSILKNIQNHNISATLKTITIFITYSNTILATKAVIFRLASNFHEHEIELSIVYQ